jgi:hypothetical protein
VGRARDTIGADEVWVLIEAGAPGWAILFHTAGAVVHVVDSKQARRFVESQGSSGAKDDRRDAASLTDMCRSERHRPAPWKPDAEELQRLDILGLAHEQVSSNLCRAKQRLRDALRNSMPVVEHALPKDLDTKWVHKFLGKVPTPWHAKKLSQAKLDELMKGAAAKTRARMWAALQDTTAPWLTAAVAETMALVVRSHLAEMALLASQLEEIERQIDEVTASMETRVVAESMGGIALLLSATLIQYAFRDGAPENRDQASILMGAAPVFVGSGKNRRGRPKGAVTMRRASASRARRATYLIGRLAMQRLRWAGAMYTDARSRGQTAATAFRRIARCVLRIQTAMVRTGKPYDEARYIAALQAQGVGWAAHL